MDKRFRPVSCLGPAIAILAIGLVSRVYAAVPPLVNLQGILTNAGGAPLPDGSYHVIFGIYDDSIAVVPPLWAETLSVSTVGGAFTVLLGNAHPLDESIFAGAERFLGMAVNPEPEMTPRLRIATAPYAHRVGTVDSAFGGTITSKVSIGPGHTNIGAQSFVAGENNSVIGDFTTIAGGQANLASGIYSAVGGGGANTVTGNVAVIGGGGQNSAYGDSSTIAGGFNNLASHLRATVGGGANNTSSGEQSTVAGGEFNTASGMSSTVGGGYANAASNVDATVGGGYADTASGDKSTVSGGTVNRASGNYSTIGGGAFNRARATSSTVAGGFQNTASADDAAVGGGYLNSAEGYRATVGGGTGNVASGQYSTVGGGEGNLASNHWTTVPGGDKNKALGISTFAAGHRAIATHDGSFVWADDVDTDFETTGPGQFLVRAYGGMGLGTNSPEGTLHVQRSSAGAVTANYYSVAVFESSQQGYLSILTPNNQERGILFGNPASPEEGVIMYDAPTTPNGFQFRTNGNITRMVLDGDGELGVGTASPDAPVHIATPIGTPVNLHFSHTSGSTNGTISFDDPAQPGGFVFALNGLIKMYLNSTGLGVNGNVRAAADIIAVNGDFSGQVCADNVACPSDARLKEDIETLDNALETVSRLRGVQYHWRRDEFPERRFPGGEQIGLVAQEVRDVVPQTVVTDQEGYLAVDYARLVPVLIEAIKEQQQTIDRQQAAIDRQSAELADLKRIVGDLQGLFREPPKDQR